MKRRLLCLASMVTVASALTACAGDDASDPEPSIEQDDQAMLATAISPIIAPLAPITWTGTVGTWPIAVWSNQPLGWLAFDIPGATSLSLSLATIDGVLLDGFFPGVIDPVLYSTLYAGPWLGGLVPSYGLLPWMNGLTGFTSRAGCAVPGFTYGLDYMPAGVIGLPGVGLGTIFPAPLTPALTSPLLVDPLLATTPLTPASALFSPMLTSSALMLNTLPIIDGLTPFVVNVTFDAATLAAQSIATLNVFSATAAVQAQSLAIQSTVLPILGMPLLPATTPLITSPLITSPLITSPIISPLL